MVATTGSAFLGLSVGCAWCHDHKYDPIPSDDYYGLAAVFTKTVRSEVEIVSGGGRAHTKVQVTGEGFRPVKHHADDRGFPHFYPKTFRLRRGDVAQKLGEAAPGVLGILTSGGRELASWKAEPPKNRAAAGFHRAAFAAWLTDPESGAATGGARHGQPALAAPFRAWDRRHAQRLRVTGKPAVAPRTARLARRDLDQERLAIKADPSFDRDEAVYMQDSRYDEARAAVDRDTLYHWRHTPRRLEAEPIRDAMLVAAGLLDTRMYGPGTLDPTMPGVASTSASSGANSCP